MLLRFLLTYDAVSLVMYLDTVIAAHSAPPGSTRHNYSPWLFLDAAHVLFQTARSRVYRGKITSEELPSMSTSFGASLQPILEEQPKWAVLSDILQEIEQDSYLNPIRDDSSSAILIMCSDQRTCRQLREYLETMHLKLDQSGDGADSASNELEEFDSRPSAELMMRRKLREYLNWKRNFSRVNENLYSSRPSPSEVQFGRGLSSSRPLVPAQNRAPPNKRRRVRGGAAPFVAVDGPGSTVQADVEQPNQVSELMEQLRPSGAEANLKEDVLVDDLEDTEDYYELYEMDDLIMIHPYDGDMDEHILEESRPRYIIMYEPDASFIRRVEVYRSSHVDRNVRVYFMYYGGSVEEQRYLSTIRRENDAFAHLIKEKGVLYIVARIGSCSLLTISLEYEHHA